MKIFVTIFLSFLLMMSLSTTASAQLFNEDFNYTAGTLLTANGWTAHSGAGTNSEKVTATGLTYTGYAGSGIGNAASFTTSGEDVNKTWASAPNGKTSGSVYYSVLVKLDSAHAAGDYFFHFLKSSSIFTGRIFAKIRTNNKISFGIAKSSTASNVSYSDSIYDAGTTYLLVVKYTFIAGTANDTLALWINPNVSGGEPAPTVLESSLDKATTDTDTLYGIAIRQGTAANAPAGMVDGIRVDTTWIGAIGYVPKVYSIGTGNVPDETGHYASLKAACDSINANANNITENRTYYITSDLTEAANVCIGGNTNESALKSCG